MKSGILIALEGLECSGKSTAIQTVKRICERCGLDTYCTREPGGTPLGEKVRGLLLETNGPICTQSELMLMAAARAQLCAEVIKPKLAKGMCVITDRFTLSTMAYQGAGRHVDLDLIQAVNDYATDSLSPDITLLLDVDVNTCLTRMCARGHSDRIEQESAQFFNKVRRGYLLAACRDPSVIVIDSNGTLQALNSAVRRAMFTFLRGAL